MLSLYSFAKRRKICVFIFLNILGFQSLSSQDFERFPTYPLESISTNNYIAYDETATHSFGVLWGTAKSTLRLRVYLNGFFIKNNSTNYITNKNFEISGGINYDSDPLDLTDSISWKVEYNGSNLVNTPLGFVKEISIPNASTKQNTTNNLYCYNRISYSGGSNTKSQTIKVHYDLIPPIPPKISIESDHLYLKAHQELIENEYWSTLYYSSDYISDGITLEYYKPSTNEGYDIEEVPIATQSGYKDLVIVNQDGIVIDSDSSDDYYEISKNGYFLYTLYNRDNLHNISAPLYLDLVEDNDAPSVVINLQNLEYTLTDNGKANIDISIVEGEVNPDITGIYVEDGLSGYSGFGGLSLYIKNDEGTFEEITSTDTSTVELNENENNIEFRNLERNNEYKIIFTAKDNVGNVCPSQDLNDIPTISIPILPILNRDDISMSWNTSGEELSISGNIIIDDIDETIDSISLFLDNPQGEGEDKLLLEMTRDELLNNQNFEIDLSQSEYSDWFRSVAHQDINITFRTALTSGKNVDTAYTLDPLPNRLPSQTSVDTLHLISADWIVIDLDNTAERYSSDYIISGTSSSVITFYNELLAKGMAFGDLYYMGSNVVLDGFQEDLDGDQIEIFPNRLEGDDWLYTIKESQGVFTQEYLLPYVFHFDDGNPSFTSLSIEAQGEMLNRASLSPDSYLTNQIPEILLLHEVLDNSGIRQIKLELSQDDTIIDSAIIENESSEEELSINWPFGEICTDDKEERYSLAITVYDNAGNSTSITNGLYIDRRSPDPQLTNNIIRVDSANIGVSYDETNSSATISFDDLFYQGDDFSVWSFSVEEATLSANENIVSDSIIADANSVSFTISDSYKPNELIPINYTFIDQAGNEIAYTLYIATPASIKSEDIQLLLTSDSLISYDDYDSSADYKLGFHKAETDYDWTQVIIERHNNGAIWSEVNPADSLETDYYDTDVIAHGNYDYRITPVNASGYPTTSAQIEYQNITVGNYSPFIQYVEDTFIWRLGKAFFGENSQLDFSRLDREEDGLSTTFFVNKDDEQTQVMRADNSLTPLEITDEEETQYVISDGNYSFSDQESYDIILHTIDSWSDSEGNVVQGEAIETEQAFTYDNQAPELTIAPEFEIMRGFPWSFSQVKTIAEDIGAGVKIMWIQITSDKMGVDEVIYDNNHPGTGELVLDGEEHIFEIPEGEYDLTVHMEDRVGNASQPGTTYLVRYDNTAPVLSEVTLAEIDGLSIDGSVYTYGTPLVKVNIGWSDSISGLAALEYEYSVDNTVISSGERTINDHDTADQIIVCPPNRTKIVEGTEYDLSVVLIDQGGNRSEKKTVSGKIRFDLTSPKITFNSWDELNYYEGSYIASTNTVSLPTVTASDILSDEVVLEYSLLDEDGDFISSESGSLTFPAQGVYQLRVTAIDEGGLESSLTLPVIYDSESPYDIVLSGIDSSSYDTYQSVILSLTAQDDITGVKSFTFDVRDGDTVLFDKDLSLGDAKSFSFEIPESVSGELSLYAKASDGVGNESDAKLVKTISLISGRELSIDAPLYYGIGQNLVAQWNYHGEREISHYSVSLIGMKSSGSSTLLNKDISTNYISIAYDDISTPETWIGFLLSIRPVTSEGVILSANQSHVITTDWESPIINSMEFPQIIRPDSLAIKWDISDDSPLDSLRFILEEVKDSGEEISFVLSNYIILSDFQNIEERNLTSLLSELDIDSTQAVRIRMTVMDKAGNLSESVSGLITVDSTDAPDYEIIDQGDYINPDENDLYFQWIWAQEDPETGEEGYYYQLSRDGILDPDNWKYTTEREVTIPGSDFNEDDYKDGTELFLLVKRDTLAGQEEILYSNGIILDRTAPVITSVSLTTLDGTPITDIFYKGSSEIQLLVDAEDQVSGIETFAVQPGIRESSSFISKGTLSSHVEEIISTSLPIDGIDSGDIISFQVNAYNGVDQESLPSFSPGIMFSPLIPEVQNVLFSYANNTAYVSWSASSSAPLNNQNIDIFRSSNLTTPIASLSVEGGKRVADISDLVLDDGSYFAKVTVTDKAGNQDTALSSRLVLDTIAPTIIKAVIPSYVYDDFSVILAADELITDINWELVSSEGILLDITKNLASSVYNWNTSLSLSDQSCWMEMSSWDEHILSFRVRVRDVMGNWSEWNSQNLIFDSTAPSTPVISRDNTLYWGATEVDLEQPLVGSYDSIDKISFTSSDETAPIYGYRWGIVSSVDTMPASWTSIRTLTSDINFLDIVDTELDGFVLTNNQAFYLAVQTINRAGLFSKVGYSERFIADLEEPGFIVSAIDPLDVVGEDTNTVYIYQGEGSFSLSVDAGELSPYLVETFRIIDSNNQLIYESIEGLDMTEGLERSIPFTFDPTFSGIHRAEMTLEDLHGRKSTKSVLFRSNPPPTIQIPDDITTRPGKSLSLEYMNWVDSLNPISSITLSSEILADDINILWGDDLSLPVLEHSTEIAQETAYQFNITYTDELNVSSSEDFVVTLKNTTEGDLLVDETWSGIHYLTGQVTIPENITLTILPDAHILALAGTEYGHQQELVLKQGGFLNIGTGVVFSSLYENEIWQGIRIYDSLTVDSITVADADRGITAMDGDYSLSLSNSTLRDNTIGLHLLNSSSHITDCLFTDNKYYGIKEDNGANPEMVDNRFSNNGFDYYDSEQTAIRAELIDGLSDENSGNRGE